MAFLDIDPVDHILVSPHADHVHLVDFHHVRLPAVRHDDNVRADIEELVPDRDRSLPQVHTVVAHVIVADAVRILLHVGKRLSGLVKTRRDNTALPQLLHGERLVIPVIYRRRTIIAQRVPARGRDILKLHGPRLKIFSDHDRCVLRVIDAAAAQLIHRSRGLRVLDCLRAGRIRAEQERRK